MTFRGDTFIITAISLAKWAVLKVAFAIRDLRSSNRSSVTAVRQRSYRNRRRVLKIYLFLLYFKYFVKMKYTFLILMYLKSLLLKLFLRSGDTPDALRANQKFSRGLVVLVLLKSDWLHAKIRNFTKAKLKGNALFQC